MTRKTTLNAGSESLADVFIRHLGEELWRNTESSEKKELQLEVGKTYLNRDRDEVTIVAEDDERYYVFEDSTGETYTATGKYFDTGRESCLDLVEEVPSIELKVGNTYLTRDGQKVTISSSDSTLYPYRGSNGHTYTKRGLYWTSGRKSGHDLISKVIKEPQLQLEVGSTYATQEGKRITIVRMLDQDSRYPYLGSDDMRYTENGRFFAWRTTEARDLVRKVSHSSAMFDPTVLTQDSLEQAVRSITAGSFGIDRANSQKPKLALIPPSALVHQALAHEDGNKKYGEYNWRGDKVKAMTCIDKILRHISCYLDGENIAHDSGVHHLGHVCSNANILLDAEETGNLIDNRPPRGKAAEVIRRCTSC